MRTRFGTVFVFHKHRGHGFIQLDGESRADVFVHYSAIERSGTGKRKHLYAGERVRVEVEDTPKGQKARLCRVVDDSRDGTESPQDAQLSGQVVHR